MGCPHIFSANLRPPNKSQPVYREDCTQCFDSLDDPTGLNVCLVCFNGGCTGLQNHAALHYTRTEHPLALNIKRSRKAIQRDEPPPKMSRIAISPTTEEDRYTTATRVVCYSCPDEIIDISASPELEQVVDGIMNSLTLSRKEEVKAWELELTSCEHVLHLDQGDRDSVKANELNRCSQCALQENLWLCLQCGNVGCGRSQFGGVGGNSHALAHAQEMTHTVAVKLNSITPEGSADIFCYSCNEERVDPEISLHLARWGIAIAEQQKTEKSLVELQIEHNLSWEFTMTSDDGSDLKPVFGPGLTGLRNLGNTCYLASILQCLFSVPEIGDRYFTPYEQPPTVRFPAEDLETQLRKMADGLLSGRYSAPNLDSVACTGSRELAYQSGLSPGMFKHLVGRGHGEFSTMRQQDAFEFLLHLFKLITVSNRTGDSNPVASFRFALEHRLQCLSCGKVRYKIDEQDNISVPVPIRRLKHDAGGNPKNDDESKKAESKFETVTLEECLDIFTEEETVELTCSGCGSTSGFRKRSLFKTFPQNLVINARRFELLNWVPTKLDIPVEVGNEPIDFSKYLSPGVQEGEDLLEDEPAPEEARFSPNPEAVNALLSMGFTETRIHNALHATGNTGADAALDWLIAHMDDPNIDKPSNLSSSGTVVVNEAEEQSKIDQLVDMGIGRLQARKALRETSGDVARAIDWVFSHPDEPSEATNILDQSKEAEFPGSSALPAVFQLNSIVCHKGTSVHTGHYVAFTQKSDLVDTQNPWILFNDEKVVQAGNFEEMKQFAYIYFFRKS